MRKRGTRVDWLPDEKMYRCILFGIFNAGVQSKELIMDQVDLENMADQMQHQLMLHKEDDDE